MSFAALKKNSTATLTKLMASTEEKSFNDERFWKPELDPAGNGYAVFRFLPAAEGEEIPYITQYDHGFQNEANGKWYIERCLSTIGKDDPVNESNNILWNTNTKANQDIVRKRKRRKSFVSNIYMISDPKHPENNGKVFLFKYGAKIFAKITDMLNPKFEDEKQVNVFDLWEGSDFKLKVVKVEGQINYDKSSFESPAPLKDNDDELESVWEAEYPLQPLIASETFKSYDELKKRFNFVLGNNEAPASRPPAQNAASNTNSIDESDDVFADDLPKKPPVTKAAPTSSDQDDEFARYQAMLDD